MLKSLLLLPDGRAIAGVINKDECTVEHAGLQPRKTGVITQRGNLTTDPHTGGSEDRGGDDASGSQATPMVASKPPEAGKRT